MPEKYEREIEEILAKSSKESKKARPSKSFLNILFRYLNQSVRIRNFKISPGRIMLVGLCLLLLALISSDVIIGCTSQESSRTVTRKPSTKKPFTKWAH